MHIYVTKYRRTDIYIFFLSFLFKDSQQQQQQPQSGTFVDPLNSGVSSLVVTDPNSVAVNQSDPNQIPTGQQQQQQIYQQT